MDLEKRTYYIDLFDVYKNLLTEKQITYFNEYYFDDYSLKEISENYNVSRNAIFDQLKKVIGLLEGYEEKLSLLKKINEIKQLSDEDLKKEKILEIIEG